MDILPEIQNRVSTREFSEKSIEKEIVIRILKAGSMAPSAKNRQPWRFIAVTKPENKERIFEACYGSDAVKTASTIIALCTTNIHYTMPNGQLSYPIDLSYASSFMMLQAEKEGLGSCIITTYDENRVKDVLTVPYSMRVVSLLCLGYKAGEHSELRERLDFSGIHNFEHW